MILPAVVARRPQRWASMGGAVAGSAREHAAGDIGVVCGVVTACAHISALR
jgi:hypothetical protein